MVKKKRRQLTASCSQKIRNKRNTPQTNQCEFCQQNLTDILYYSRNYTDSCEESAALINDKLCLFTGNEENIPEIDQIPTLKITDYTVYDKNSHLCYIDQGLIESNVLLYVDGYIKPIYDEDVSSTNGIAAHGIGPINEWYIMGFDGGNRSPIGITTSYAQYILMEPSQHYRKFVESLHEKIKLLQIVVAFLFENYWKDPTFEDLLDCVTTSGISEDFLLQHAQFICDQIFNFNDSGDDDKPLMATPCVQYLIEMCNVTFDERKLMKKTRDNVENLFKNSQPIKATTTELVRSIFENYNEKTAKTVINSTEISRKTSQKVAINPTEWCGRSLGEIHRKQFYNSARIGDDIVVKRGDFVVLNTENGKNSAIARIQYLYDLQQTPLIHVQIFLNGDETILGETADRYQLFATNTCENCPLGSITGTINVNYHQLPENWTNPTKSFQNCLYFCKFYEIETATFRDYVEDDYGENYDFCVCCRRKSLEIDYHSASLHGDAIKWRGDTYRIGSGVFLDPNVYQFTPTINDCPNNNPIRDDVLYPESYRKTSDFVQGSNVGTPEPFCCGEICEIRKKSGKISIKVRIFYRPENTKSGPFLAASSNLNLLYWTNEIITTSFDNVMGKCYLRYLENDEDPDNWSDKGAYRFYYNQSYNTKTFQFGGIPESPGGYKSLQPSKYPEWPQIRQPLNCMDVFAGCGGLTNGLHKSGVAVTKWAIEIDPSAADAFKLNHPNCCVLTGDCNDYLQQILNDTNRKLPRKGDVELLVGGPPCQGFSGMNRFNSRQYSQLKNSLIVAFLSFCDYYRPKYFLLENVRNFATFKRSIIFKLTLKCLLTIGYQIRFGVLQAGHYGVPQTRRRFILIGAAPGCDLPELPEPLHVFNKRTCYLDLILDGCKYRNGSLWTESAPYRTICVRDAISDLPEIINGTNRNEIWYDDDARTHIQRKLRDCGTLYDHICKEMAAIVVARIAHIPPASDWRDLPNIAVVLSDGSRVKKLEYHYRFKKQRSYEPPRGVCRCATGTKCDPNDRQLSTLIPWCLPHTANRHNNWAGLYGRLEWDGFFGTTITNPEPMGKQGRVLHPEQDRVVSVRECARSQGFPDSYRFCGNIMDKYRQIGNAVPPPLGYVIGLEIGKVLEKQQMNSS